MKSVPVKIACISNNKDRAEKLAAQLNADSTVLDLLTFTEVSFSNFDVQTFDLIVFDCVTNPYIDFKEIFTLRIPNDATPVPFIFILHPKQKKHRPDILEDQYSASLLDPYDEIELITLSRSLASVRKLEQKTIMYDDVIESEKKLIYHLDTILQIPSLGECRTNAEYFFTLQTQFTQRMELTFAAEHVVFFEYDDKNKLLIRKSYGKSVEDIENLVSFDFSRSEVRNAFLKNQPVVFEHQTLTDPFVQETEESSGSAIRSMMFVPLMVIQKPMGGFALINKISRPVFNENDIALSMITVQKMIYHLEGILLRNMPAMETGESSPDLKEMLDALKFGVIIFNRRFELLYMNKFARLALRVKPSEKLNLNRVLGPQAPLEIRKFFEKNEFPVLRQEMMVVREEDRTFYMGYSIYEITTGKMQRFALTFMEISQTKRLQAEIIRMDRMASLGVLASGIAHEIRNPLAGIKAMAQTLQEELQDDKGQVEYVERIVRQVNRLDELLKSFFSYAKPQRPNPIRCKIPDIVREVLPLFRRKIKENNITVKEVYSRDLKEIFVDFHQIEQVFFNLIINAIDAMSKGGTLTIRARLPEETQLMIDRRQRIPKLFSDVYNEITISDTGVGMDSDTLNNMYNPFFTTKSYGTGLGLSIVYQIILEHGGQITVDSEMGKGTNFRILLPVYVEKSQAQN